MCLEQEHPSSLKQPLTLETETNSISTVTSRVSPNLGYLYLWHTVSAMCACVLVQLDLLLYVGKGG